MKKIILPGLIALSSLAFTSCLDTKDENDMKETLTYGGDQCFNVVVTDKAAGEFFVSSRPQYSFLLAYGSQTITPDMSGISLADGTTGYAFKLPAMGLATNNSYSFSCTGHDIMPAGQNVYTFDNFSFTYTQRILYTEGQYYQAPTYNIKYTISDPVKGKTYDVTVFPARYDLFGNTVATPPTGIVDEYTDNKALYSIILDQTTKTATIKITEAKFGASLPTVTMYAKEVPYEVLPTGIVIKTGKQTVENDNGVATEESVRYQLYDSVGKVKDAYFSDIDISIAVPSGITTLHLHANIDGLNGNSEVTDYDIAASLSYNLISE